MLLGNCCCSEKCGDCTDCCTDALPNSLDITFGSGWMEPTIDPGKLGCEDDHVNICAQQLDGQTFNLTSPSGTSACGLALSADCSYDYQDLVFCNTNYAGVVAKMNLWASFQCYPSGLCRIDVKLEICLLGSPIGAGRSDYWWKTADFARGGESCSGLSKTAIWWFETQTGNADPEGFCVSPGSPARDVLVEDGG